MIEVAAVNGVSFVEQVSAWSTAAVAALALVALFLPWWDRRRHERAVNRRVGLAALPLKSSVDALLDAADLKGEGLSLEDAKRLIPKLVVIRERLASLADVAAGGSGRVADLVAVALSGISFTVYGLEQTVTISEDARAKRFAASQLKGAGAILHAELTICLRALTGLTDKRPENAFWQELKRATAEFGQKRGEGGASPPP